MYNAVHVAARLRDALPGSHAVRALEPGSVEISISLKDDPSFCCSVVYPSAEIRGLLDEGIEALRAKLHERCVDCERRAICRAA